MTGQELADPNRERPAETITDNELKATIYLAVGVASEGSVRGRNVAYELSFAGYIHQSGETSRRQPIEAGAFRDGQLEPIYNSGYSIGTLQTDFGQQRNDPDRNADQLLNAYQVWAREQVNENPGMLLTQQEYNQASLSLRRQGNEIRGDRQTAIDNGYDIPTGIKTRLNAFMASDAGITYVHNQDVRQIDHLLREGGAVRQLEDTSLYQNATQDDQIRMATVIAKLENQDGARHWPGVIEQINDGSIDSLDGIKAGVPQHLRGDRDNALRGAEVVIALRNAEDHNPLHTAWQNVVANPLANPTQLNQDRARPNLEAEYSTVKSLFLISGQAKAFVQTLDDSGHRAQDVRFQGAPRDQTAGLYVSGNDFAQWNRDGHGYANIDGQWNEIERSQIRRVDQRNGVVDLNINRNGTTERLLHVDPNEPVLRPVQQPAEPAQPAPIAPTNQQNVGSFAANQAPTIAPVMAPPSIGGSQSMYDDGRQPAIEAGRALSNAIGPIDPSITNPALAFPPLIPATNERERDEREESQQREPQISTSGPFNDPYLDKTYAALMAGDSNQLDRIAIEFAHSPEGQRMAQMGDQLLAQQQLLEQQQLQEQRQTQARQGPVMSR
ncbi:hypothetical protein XcuCFBP2542_12085 [Xanthomonas cucurbitae]|uniref:Uncharacterized protein n=1 Tax=Xanthomonas cucurbitae TaxID=56453 RepID=A0A2S7DQ31_9XANT|nr:hypothetical protein [Xanthomonas cucurbitae]PPU75904.1 hypothetical protein XcuCFBP2542_12085 [Xanthomonas cucurbitae]WDM79536.1 hypothetical protein K6980_01955 [Xanthomonas cucurbitae]WDM83226.1 hypothetical protein K6979_01970 [Xanthomonas cucurbitae]